jgi:hypothetical protein
MISKDKLNQQNFTICNICKAISLNFCELIIFSKVVMFSLLTTHHFSDFSCAKEFVLEENENYQFLERFLVHQSKL